MQQRFPQSEQDSGVSRAHFHHAAHLEASNGSDPAGSSRPGILSRIRAFFNRNPKAIAFGVGALAIGAGVGLYFGGIIDAALAATVLTAVAPYVVPALVVGLGLLVLVAATYKAIKWFTGDNGFDPVSQKDVADMKQKLDAVNEERTNIADLRNEIQPAINHAHAAAYRADAAAYRADAAAQDADAVVATFRNKVDGAVASVVTDIARVHMRHHTDSRAFFSRQDSSDDVVDANSVSATPRQK